MKPRLSLFSLLGLLVLLHPNAAGTSAPAQKQPTPNYYPLQVGTTWHYQLTANGNQAKLVNKIARIEKIDGKNLAVLEGSVNGKVVANEHLFQDAEGVFRFRADGKVVTPPLCLLKYPIKANAKWSGEFTAAGEKGKYSAEAKVETIKVPTGEYKTIRVDLKVEDNNQKVVTTYWFAAGIGVVKQTLELPNLNVVVELEKFERAK